MRPCVFNSSTYHGDHAAGSDAVAYGCSHQALVVWVLAPPSQHLLAHEVGLLVDHEEAALHPAGVTPAQVGGELGAVAAGLIRATLKVLVLVEDDLQKKKRKGNCTAKKYLSFFLIF